MRLLSGLLLHGGLLEASLGPRVRGDHIRADCLPDSESHCLPDSESHCLPDSWPDCLPDPESNCLPDSESDCLPYAKPHQLSHRPSLR